MIDAPDRREGGESRAASRIVERIASIPYCKESDMRNVSIERDNGFICPEEWIGGAGDVIVGGDGGSVL